MPEWYVELDNFKNLKILRAKLFVSIHIFKAMLGNMALKMWILTKSFAFNIFRFLKLSYSFVIIHSRYIVYMLNYFNLIQVSNLLYILMLYYILGYDLSNKCGTPCSVVLGNLHILWKHRFPPRNLCNHIELISI